MVRVETTSHGRRTTLGGTTMPRLVGNIFVAFPISCLVQAYRLAGATTTPAN